MGRLIAYVAQSVEHFLGKEEVTGSNPVMGSKKATVLGDEWLVRRKFALEIVGVMGHVEGKI